MKALGRVHFTLPFFKAHIDNRTRRMVMPKERTGEMKMKTMIKSCLLMVIVCCMISFPLMTGCAAAEKASFSQWNDCESIDALKAYVQAVTDPSGDDFIPVEDRLAVFDLDGTLVGEQFPIYFEWMLYCQRVLADASYTPTKEQLDVARQILDASTQRHIPEGVEEREHIRFGEAFAGMSNADFRQYVFDFLQMSADGFQGLTLADAFFRPMTEVVDYLLENDFTLYIVSGTDRDAVRIMAAGFLELPQRQIIGSDYYSIASGQGDAGYLEYQFSSDDIVIRGSQSIIKNVKMSKVMQIAQELGKQPVLAFGNSTGDQSMFAYTTYHNPYRAAAFCLIPDDDERDYAYPDKADRLLSLCSQNGWYPISMKNDFKTMYAPTVTKSAEHTPWLDAMLARLEELTLNAAA